MRSDLKKTRLFHLRNVEKPPHPQFYAQRARDKIFGDSENDNFRISLEFSGFTDRMILKFSIHI